MTLQQPFILGAFVLLTFLPSVNAATITLAGDPIKGGELIAGTFTEAPQGQVNDTNSTPGSGNENAQFAIDGVITTKYLNFGQEDTGYIVIPAIGSSVVNGISFVTGNDSPGRDPASYILYGSNTLTSLAASIFTLAGNGFSEISNGAISLPNTGLNITGNLANSEGRGYAGAVSFANTTAYSSYILVFPSIRDTSNNSMQIAEAALTFTPVPEPATAAFLALSLLGSVSTRRRRQV